MLNFFIAIPPDPCKTVGCNAPYNIGCRTVNKTAECICPTCPETRNPVCTSDDVQDVSACVMRRQSCLSGDLVTIAKSGPCGMQISVAFTKAICCYTFNSNTDTTCPP